VNQNPPFFFYCPLDLMRKLESPSRVLFKLPELSAELEMNKVALQLDQMNKTFGKTLGKITFTFLGWGQSFMLGGGGIKQLSRYSLIIL
jgi:hypothetical protein